MITKRSDAYVHWNGGICCVLEYPGQKPICKSVDFRRATRRARHLGYNVKVYKSHTDEAPRDAVMVRMGSYVLPAMCGEKWR